MIWLDNSRILSIFSVVFLHVAAGVVTGTEIGSGNWWVGNIYDSAVRWCVPVFVMISGALLLGNDKNENLKTFYQKRATRLLIPIIFWSAIYLSWNALKLVVGEKEVSLLVLTMMLASGKPHYHMWFLYMIAFLYVFTPFLIKITKNSSNNELVILTIISLVLAILNSAVNTILPSTPTLFVNWFLSYIPYFILGHLIATSETKFTTTKAATTLIASVALTSIGCYILANYKNLDTGIYFYGNLSITAVPMSISVMFILKKWTKPMFSEKAAKKLSSLTLGIYFAHPMILEIINYFYVKATDYPAALYVPVLTLALFGISLGIAWVASKTPFLRRTI